MRGGAPRRAYEHSVEIATEGVNVPHVDSRIGRFCKKALLEAGFSTWEVSILLCDDQRISELNRRYRHRHGATDVLSFPREEKKVGEPVAGDIAISLDTLRRNAAKYEVSENDEMKRLLVHGLLHLAGMDHGRGKGRHMLAVQEKLLDALHSEKIFGETAK
jgi:probable rRNA maturation factor